MSSKLQVIGSGSQGNSYALYCGNEILLIELGLPEKSIKKAIDFELEKVIGCLASHTHLDHLLPNTANAFLRFGIPILSTSEAKEKIKGIKYIQPKTKVRVGSFTVQPIPVSHNVECFAFIIEHELIGKCLFATDLNGFPYRIKDLNHIFIEANYSEDIIVNNACCNSWNNSASDNHLEITQAVEIIKENYTSKLQTVVLLHLSAGNSNAKQFAEITIRETSLFNVFIADKGLEIELKKEEF